MGEVTTGRHRVAVLVRHGVRPLELGLVHQIFGQARLGDGTAPYEVLTCAARTGAVRTDSDFAVHVEHDYAALTTADTVVVPASQETDEDDDPLDHELRAALSALGPEVRVASVCTGAFVLAAAGLLDGRRATTHWLSAERFRTLYPRVRLDPDVLYVDEGRVLTSAGEASGIDLCLHMVRGDHGVAVANDVARRTVVPPHRAGGQAQFLGRPVPEPQVATTTAAARAWALERLHEPIALTDLAAVGPMSVRTLTRAFRAELGMSPTEWIVQRRLDLACELLERSDLPVEQIADRAGFGSASGLRKHFVARLGIAPRSYRTTFRVRG
jgi:transcriptional regulator GlxA family with amidase domain